MMIAFRLTVRSFSRCLYCKQHTNICSFERILNAMDSPTLKTVAQLEYATKAVDGSGLCVGIVCEGGVLLVALCRIKNEYQDRVKFNEKIHQLHPTVACAVAGRYADANVLLNRLKKEISQYIHNYHKTPPCKKIVKAARKLEVSKADQIERRPLAVSILCVGWGEDTGYELIMSEPSGNVSSWTMKAIGSNAACANQLLMDKIGGKRISLEQAKYVALEALAINIGVKFMNGMQVEMATLKSVGDGHKINIHSHEEVTKICEQFKQEYGQKQK